MISPSRAHHQLIWKVLSTFDEQYLTEHEILFGGGTRIALELNEYRESTDIDFFCHGAGAYRAVRDQITSNSLGNILKPDCSLNFLREIRADRDAVRTFVSPTDEAAQIKLEFIHFNLCDITSNPSDTLFNVAVVDRETCYTTKLLANADRYTNPDHKDIFDLCMMKSCWGEIPETAWNRAVKAYGQKTIVNGLIKALENFKSSPKAEMETATTMLIIDKDCAEHLVYEASASLLSEVQAKAAE